MKDGYFFPVTAIKQKMRSCETCGTVDHLAAIYGESDFRVYSKRERLKTWHKKNHGLSESEADALFVVDTTWYYYSFFCANKG